MGQLKVMYATCRERFAFWQHTDSVKESQIVLAARGIKIAETYDTPTYVRQGRQGIAKHFVESDATHLLFVDSDNVLHQETVWRLLKHELPIVGALYFKRREAPEAVAFAWNDVERTQTYSKSQFVRDWLVEHNAPVVNSPVCYDLLGNTVVDFDVIGFGCTLIRRDVLETMFAKQDDLFGGHGEELGEDTYFCKLAQDCGYRPAIDLALHIGHLKTAMVTTEDFMKVSEWQVKQ